MAKPRLIQQRPRDLSPGALSGDRGREIPADLLREASSRLGITALLGVVLWIVGALLDHLTLYSAHPGDPRWRQLHPPDAIVGLAILASIGLFAYSRKSTRSPAFLLDLGLVYLVVTCFELGLIGHWNPVAGGHSIEPTFTWVGTLVLMFAAILPNPPWKTLVAGLIAASMNPLGMIIAHLRGTWDFGPYWGVLLMHYPDYIMVGVSVVISRVHTRLGMQVSHARELGSYQLNELLGRGGMGEVYRATHHMLARPAAIKLIRPETLGAVDSDAARTAVRRFRREAEVAASLRSPHTVELYDFGVTEDNTFYFVMELLDGLDLERLVGEFGPLPPNRVIHVLMQVCESLEEAHVLGLVHRDIKPANIHLGKLGLRHDVVKVLDFGLVKAMEGAELGNSLGTGADVAPGTPGYMAPEVALGGGFDGRADLYALGCVAYFLLTQEVVFSANTAFQAVARHINDVPVPPSKRTSQVIPPELEAIVLSLLAKKPEDRPANAAVLSTALEAVPIPPWNEALAAAWWRMAGKGIPAK